MQRRTLVLLAVGLASAAAFAAPKPRTSTSGTLSGTVVVCGEPTAGVVFIDEKSYFTKTTTGEFQLTNVPAGIHSLVVEAVGESAITIPVNFNGGEQAASASFCPDADRDGYDRLMDCNDQSAAAKPGALEVCNDNLDNNCDGTINEGCALVCAGGELQCPLSGCVDLNSDTANCGTCGNVCSNGAQCSSGQCVGP